MSAQPSKLDTHLHVYSFVNVSEIVVFPSPLACLTPLFLRL
jgi:hypothetical protein